jgi:hypothetical protein
MDGHSLIVEPCGACGEPMFRAYCTCGDWATGEPLATEAACVSRFESHRIGAAFRSLWASVRGGAGV